MDLGLTELCDSRLEGLVLGGQLAIRAGVSCRLQLSIGRVCGRCGGHPESAERKKTVAAITAIGPRSMARFHRSVATLLLVSSGSFHAEPSAIRPLVLLRGPASPLAFVRPAPLAFPAGASDQAARAACEQQRPDGQLSDTEGCWQGAIFRACPAAVTFLAASRGPRGGERRAREDRDASEGWGTFSPPGRGYRDEGAERRGDRQRGGKLGYDGHTGHSDMPWRQDREGYGRTASRSRGEGRGRYGVRRDSSDDGTGPRRQRSNKQGGGYGGERGESAWRFQAMAQTPLRPGETFRMVDLAPSRPKRETPKRDSKGGRDGALPSGDAAGIRINKCFKDFTSRREADRLVEGPCRPLPRPPPPPSLSLPLSPCPFLTVTVLQYCYHSCCTGALVTLGKSGKMGG